MSVTSYINSNRVIGVTSSAPVAIYNINPNASIRIWYTSAGTATVYSSGSAPEMVARDIAAGAAAITGNTNAQWTQWSAGAVTADTTLGATMFQTAVAIVVTSGTWVIEVCQ